MVFNSKAYDELFHADDADQQPDAKVYVKPKKESAQVTDSAIDTPEDQADEPEYNGAGDPPEDDLDEPEGGED